METELKLAMSPEGLRRLMRSRLWAAWRTSDVRQQLRTLYFDTPDGALARAGIALRVRRAGRDWIQTVKGGGGAVGGLHRREEVEARVGGPRPELAKVPASLLRGALGRADVRERLGVVFETRFDRLARTLHADGGAVIEVAFDRGSVLAAGGETPICEIELELKAGHTTDLLDLARAVVQAGGWLDDTSKAARGYRLAWPDIAPPPAPATAAPPPAAEVSEWHTLITSAVATGIGHLHGNAAGVRDDHPDPEYIHQMRVALRRLRTLLSIARRRSDHPLTGHLLAETRWLGSVLGPARDWDVLLDETLPAHLAAHGAPPGWVRLLADVAVARRAARAVAAQAVASPRYGELVLDLLAWLELPAPAGRKRAAAVAREQLERRHRNVLRLGQPEALVDDDARHRLRLACKKLRYTAESLAPAFAPDAADRYIGALSQLQKSLGSLNDAAVAALRLDSLPAGRAVCAREAVKRHLEQIAATRLQSLAGQWRTFCAINPFWDK
ncbi:MAG: CHAD domain-containing protein [Rhodocyclaceae bacterium]|nr:CHAD domain-containing protein [Rhodocyclaceae bacterium]